MIANQLECQRHHRLNQRLFKERAHYDKAIDVLDGLTYHKEGFLVSEQGQEGMSAGVIDEFVLSKNESLIKVFDQLVEQHL